jgi:hypothetical protein
MAVPTIIATPGAVDANSYATRSEADAYHDTRLHATDWPANVSATAAIGAGANGVVTTTVDAPGTEGNDWTIEVVAGVGLNVAMTAALVGTDITVTLGTDGAGAADATKNTAVLVAAAIAALSGVAAVASGTGATVIPVTAETPFTGGSYVEETKNVALIMATRVLDSMYIWAGYASSATQALQWPRSGVLDARRVQNVAVDVIPQELKNATAELARLLIASDTTVQSGTAGGAISSITAGPVSISYSSGVVISVDVVPGSTFNLLPSWWGYLRGLSGTRELVRA